MDKSVAIALVLALAACRPASPPPRSSSRGLEARQAAPTTPPLPTYRVLPRPVDYEDSTHMWWTSYSASDYGWFQQLDSFATPVTVEFLESPAASRAIGTLTLRRGGVTRSGYFAGRRVLRRQWRALLAPNSSPSGDCEVSYRAFVAGGRDTLSGQEALSLTYFTELAGGSLAPGQRLFPLP